MLWLWQGGQPESLVDEWKCTQAIEKRPAGAKLPSPGTHGQWQYLDLRDVLSDHHAVIASRK